MQAVFSIIDIEIKKQGIFFLICQDFALKKES